MFFYSDTLIWAWTSIYSNSLVLHVTNNPNQTTVHVTTSLTFKSIIGLTLKCCLLSRNAVSINFLPKKTLNPELCILGNQTNHYYQIITGTRIVQLLISWTYHKTIFQSQKSQIDLGLCLFYKLIFIFIPFLSSISDIICILSGIQYQK